MAFVFILCSRCNHFEIIFLFPYTTIIKFFETHPISQNFISHVVFSSAFACTFFNRTVYSQLAKTMWGSVIVGKKSIRRFITLDSHGFYEKKSSMGSLEESGLRRVECDNKRYATVRCLS